MTEKIQKTIRGAIMVKMGVLKQISGKVNGAIILFMRLSLVYVRFGAFDASGTRHVGVDVLEVSCFTPHLRCSYILASYLRLDVYRQVIPLFPYSSESSGSPMGWYR